MNQRWTDIHPVALPVLLFATILGGAVMAGMATAYIGSRGEFRAVYYIAVFVLFVAGSIVAITRREPLRFVFFATILGFPIMLAAVPPARFGLTVFDVVMAILAVGLVGRRMLGTATVPIFPTASLAIAWLVALPCVVFSQFPAQSFKSFVVIFAVYAFFLLTLEELKRERGFERLVGLLSIVLIIMAVGCFVERVTHVNLSLRGDNLNQLSYATGLEIYRAGGFFQDPQKGGTWFAIMIAFLLIAVVRGRLRDAKLNLLAWIGIVLGTGALITTVSRAAIAACVVICALALFAFNRWNAAVKLFIAGGVVSAAIVAAMIPPDVWLSLVPREVAERFENPGRDLELRMRIWFDTWNMFADHPLTGIGFGAFQDYLKYTQPTVFNYYGLGEATGVVYIPDNPESGYLKILYEGGIAGSAAVLIVALDALRRSVGVMFGDRTPDARTEVIGALVALLIFSVTFVTLFTPADARIAALVAFCLALIWHHSPARGRATRQG